MWIVWMGVCVCVLSERDFPKLYIGIKCVYEKVRMKSVALESHMSLCCWLNACRSTMNMMSEKFKNIESAFFISCESTAHSIQHYNTCNRLESMCERMLWSLSCFLSMMPRNIFSPLSILSKRALFVCIFPFIFLFYLSILRKFIFPPRISNGPCRLVEIWVLLMQGLSRQKKRFSFSFSFMCFVCFEWIECIPLIRNFWFFFFEFVVCEIFRVYFVFDGFFSFGAVLCVWFSQILAWLSFDLTGRFFFVAKDSVLWTVRGDVYFFHCLLKLNAFLSTWKMFSMLVESFACDALTALFKRRISKWFDKYETKFLYQYVNFNTIIYRNFCFRNRLKDWEEKIDWK